MIVKNTEENRIIQNVAATMTLSGMPLSKKDILELMKVANGEKTTEELRQEIIAKYKCD